MGLKLWIWDLPISCDPNFSDLWNLQGRLGYVPLRVKQVAIGGSSAVQSPVQPRLLAFIDQAATPSILKKVWLGNRPRQYYPSLWKLRGRNIFPPPPLLTYAHIPPYYNLALVWRGKERTFRWTLRCHSVAVKEIDLLYILDLWRQDRTRQGGQAEEEGHVRIQKASHYGTGEMGHEKRKQTANSKVVNNSRNREISSSPEVKKVKIYEPHC